MKYLTKFFLLSASCLLVILFQCSKQTRSEGTNSEWMRTVEGTVPDSAQLSFIRNDSLKRLLETASEPVKIQIYHQLCQAYVWSWPDSAIEYATRGLELSAELEILSAELDFLSYLTAAYSEIGNFSIALERAFVALELAKKQDNPFIIASCISDIGSVYFYSGDYENAIIYFRQLQNDPSVFKASEELYATFLGETYFHLNRFDSARFYLTKAYELEINNTSHWNVPYLYMGKLVEKEGKFNEALEFYKASIKEKVPEADYIKTYLAIADLFDKTNQLDSGIYYGRLAYALSKNTSFYIFTFEAASLLSKIYHTNNHIDSAFYYQELMLTEKDRIFSREKMAELQNLAYEEQKKIENIRQDRLRQRNLIIFLSLAFTLFIFGVITFILYRNNHFRKKAYRLLEKQKAEIDTQKSRLEETLSSLRLTQAQLIQSEKMASLGELTAGIAHEIQNPLNFVNNFSELNKDLVAELKEEIAKGNFEEVEKIMNDIVVNEEKINHHGKRADAIVKSMLQHSRTSSGEKEYTDINALCDEYLRLAYHGFLAKDKSFNANFKLDLDVSLPSIKVVPQDIGRVLLNLINNAFQAVSKVDKPEVLVSTKKLENSIEITVEDNGIGIPDGIKNKIFQPFFTTKPAGEGTGLGLSLAYDIMKAHGGEIRVETNEKGSTFSIKLPI